MLEFVTTGDGSKTIFNSEVGENYHSKHGALQESKHVFLHSGLVYFLEKSHTTDISILEVGFGTGLNFLLSADYCSSKGINLEYIGIEAYPLSPEMISQTGYEEYIPEDTWNKFLQLYSDSLKQPVSLNHHCQLQTARCKLLDFKSDAQFDTIYFDAFASIHQPEMWDEASIKHAVQFLKPGGVFVTYAITGNLKRLLKSLGMEVQKVPGAPGKREMLRAIRCVNVQM